MRSSGRTRLAAFAGALAFVAAACAPDSADSEADAAEAPAPAPAAAPAMSAPDTTGAAIWAHIHDENYAEDWDLWPDKGRQYPGQDPHGAQLTTMMNDVAYDALMAGAEEFPNGSIVVKQNFMPDGTLAAVTTMYKHDGYNAEHNDWFFSKHLASGELDQMPNGMAMEGRLPGCQGCHISKQDNDYIFTGELGN